MNHRAVVWACLAVAAFFTTELIAQAPRVPAGPIAPPGQVVAPAPTTMIQPQPGQQFGPQPPRQAPPRVATRQQVPLPPRTPQAPFQLNAQQEADLYRVLQAWEKNSNAVQTLSSDFMRWDYDLVFGQKDPQNPNHVVPKESKGQIKYAAPDKGLYHITEIATFSGMANGERQYQRQSDGGEHWICDGKSIWEYNYEKKQLIERRLPPEMQGKAISDGPLPFLFGAEADKLLARYWMRVVTPPAVQGQIWLEAFPKHQIDAANFQRATVILDAKTMFPSAIEIHLPNGKSRHVHQFHNNQVNNVNLFQFFKGDFFKPSLPRGWTKLEDAPRS